MIHYVIFSCSLDEIKKPTVSFYLILLRVIMSLPLITLFARRTRRLEQSHVTDSLFPNDPFIH